MNEINTSISMDFSIIYSCIALGITGKKTIRELKALALLGHVEAYEMCKSLSINLFMYETMSKVIPDTDIDEDYFYHDYDEISNALAIRNKNAYNKTKNPIFYQKYLDYSKSYNLLKILYARHLLKKITKKDNSLRPNFLLAKNLYEHSSNKVDRNFAEQVFKKVAMCECSDYIKRVAKDIMLFEEIQLRRSSDAAKLKTKETSKSYSCYNYNEYLID